MAQSAKSTSKSTSKPAPHGREVGRYLMFGQIGSGGTATVHFGRLRADGGFARTVALKRLHAHLASDPYFVSLFFSEARLAARVSHPNVASLLDVVRLGSGELLLVMDYVHGETLAALLGLCRRREDPIPPRIASAIMMGILMGLHAAHEAVDEHGRPLGLVHGDVSPHNVIVGADGSARVLDFGVARADVGSIRDRRVIGTLAYMAPERLRGTAFDRRSDLFGAGVLLWEMLAMRRLFTGADGRSKRAMAQTPSPGRFRPEISPELDAVVMRALRAEANDRPENALAFARELERAEPPASTREVADWLNLTAGARLRERAEELSRIERSTAPSLMIEDDDMDDVPTTAANALRPPIAPRPSGRRLPTLGDDEPTLFDAQPAFKEIEAARRAFPSTPTPQLSPLPGSPSSESAHSPPPPPMRNTGQYAVTPALRARPGRWVAVGALCAVFLGAGAWRLRGGDAVAASATMDTDDGPSLARAAASAATTIAKLEVIPAAPPPAAEPAAAAEAAALETATPETAAPETATTEAVVTEAATTEIAPAEEPPAPEQAPAVLETPAIVVDDGVVRETRPARRASAQERQLRGAAALRAKILALHTQGKEAYERLDPASALRHFEASLRLCQELKPGDRQLTALTHVHVGIVLAGGFKQRGLAARHFRLARGLVPTIAPTSSARTPEIEAALAEADGSLPRPR